MSKTNEEAKQIRRVVNETRLIDTHEHLQREDNRVKGEVDVLATFLLQYASSDLISSGLSYRDYQTILDPHQPLEKRWEIFSPYWERMKNTSYARVLDIAARDLYGYEINDQTYKKISDKMKEVNKKGLYRWVLKEKAGIEISLQDTLLKPKSYAFWKTPSTERLLDVDREFFVPVHRFEDYLLLQDRIDIESIGQRRSARIHSLSDLVKNLEAEFHEFSMTIAAVKLWLGYRRPLKFEKATFSEAEQVFNNICSQKTFVRVDAEGVRITAPSGISLDEAKPLHDFMVHKVIQLAGEYSVPVQIHTGFHEGNENLIANTNPLNLTNLFMEYREVKFDIFHGAYPWIGECSALAKTFPNVYLDLAWLHVVSPYIAREALSEWLETVPANKILGFGGDYVFVEGSYGHSVIARDNIARVLTQKVEDGDLKLEEAKALARKILRENAKELFLKRIGIQ
ncbi:MAG: amidohydrolase family protein [Candidatus Bathyarchaeia archaeon]